MTGPGLARFLTPPPSPSAGPRPESCDVCGTVVESEHDHLVDGENRSLLCACRACALLFSNPGAGAGRYLPVPSRVLYDPGFELAMGEWDELQIPVGLAFFFLNSELDRWVAFYPSPAGATESVLPQPAWDEVLDRNPALRAASPDVEALLVRRQGDRFRCFLVPIDACYQLVGLVRLYWKGFDGGAEVHRAIDGFFRDLSRRARPIGRD